MLFLVGCDLVYPRIPKIALRCPCYLIWSRVWQNLLVAEIAGFFSAMLQGITCASFWSFCMRRDIWETKKPRLLYFDWTSWSRQCLNLLIIITELRRLVVLWDSLYENSSIWTNLIFLLIIEPVYFNITFLQKDQKMPSRCNFHQV